MLAQLPWGKEFCCYSVAIFWEPPHWIGLPARHQEGYPWVDNFYGDPSPGAVVPTFVVFARDVVKTSSHGKIF